MNCVYNPEHYGIMSKVWWGEWGGGEIKETSMKQMRDKEDKKEKVIKE